MAKDSQLDPKEIRSEKTNGGPTSARSGFDGQSRNAKTQSGNRKKAGDDKARS